MLSPLARALFVWIAACAGGGRWAAADENWTQFRGPTGQGLSTATGLPLTWSESEHVKWKTPVHDKAWSSPVVFGGQVWMTTATEDGRELFAFAVDRETGKVLHDVMLFGVDEPQYADRFNSYGSPTPVIEEGRVYVSFGSAGTACLDTATGKVLWQRRDLACNHFRGPGSSPTLWRNLLILHFDGSDLQYVVALDKADGHTVWKTDRSIDFKDLTPEGKPIRDGDFRKAFSTPLVVTHAGEPLLVSVGSNAIYGYEPATGKELWRVEDRRYHSGTVRPVVGHGMAFAATGLPKGELWAIKLGGRGDVTDSHVAWKLAGNVPNRPSPVLSGELLFMVNQDTGIVTCVEALTGKVVWRERLPGLGKYSASPLHAGGRLYFFNENGRCPVIAASREFKVLAENKLDGGFMASPAVADRALIVRSTTHVYRLEN